MRDVSVRLAKPTPRWREEFLAAVKRSRRLHGRFAHPPADEAAFDRWMKRLRRPSNESHLIVHEHDGLVGVVNISEIVCGVLMSGYLGYYAFAPHARKRYMTAGLALVVDRAFGELGLHRLEANIQPENAASIALVTRLGFSREGYSPRYLKLGGRWRDHERWALLAENWQRVRR
ncbi:MAG: acetyltransferase [Candidatus Hydrogenedentota bacterium]